ncbi:sulfotransferase 1E1-like [Mytilus trossulus]|uniref:sulfotransferase 1E1-like n=1 Tax=Mytilus trossulus TaxID=6551 RepID=UPI003007DE32
MHQICEHWVHEMVSMLLHQTTEYNSHGELNDCNFECKTDWDLLEQLNSPRFFQTHLPLKYFPRKHVENGYRIIYLNRNPKDRAVSNFHFMHKKRSTCWVLATIPTLRELVSFLGVTADDEFLHDIADKCSFANMKNNKTDVSSTINSGKTVIWRKGIIGDWKNLFTVAQNETCDQMYEQEMKGCDVKFTYNAK